MTYRTAHGKASGSGPRIEVLPIDELPSGMPAPAAQQPPPLPGERPTAFTPMQAGTERTRELARRGAAARWDKERKRVKILECLGLVDTPTDIGFHPYLIQAEEFALKEVERLAAEVGAGHCPINAASLVQSAALQLASSRYLFACAAQDDKKIALASKLADASRQNLLAAHELTVRTAQQRPSTGNATERALQDILGPK